MSPGTQKLVTREPKRNWSESKYYTNQRRRGWSSEAVGGPDLDHLDWKFPRRSCRTAGKIIFSLNGRWGLQSITVVLRKNVGWATWRCQIAFYKIWIPKGTGEYFSPDFLEPLVRTLIESIWKFYEKIFMTFQGNRFFIKVIWQRPNVHTTFFLSAAK